MSEVPYVRLGRTGVRVSRLCLGTMNFGPDTPEPDAHAIMDRALEAGINFFDTANVYGWRRGEGWTEQIIGRWFAGGGRRDVVVLATKVYGTMGDGPNDRGLSAFHIVRACEASLRRLRTDRIDLYQMHHIDRDTPPDEIWQAMETLIRQGKVLYVGSSNFPAWHIAEMHLAGQQRNLMGLVSEQCPYSLADRTVELEVIPAAERFGLAVIPWSPLGGGLLAGILDNPAAGRRASERTRQRLARHREQVARYEDLCRRIGAPPARVALAWLLTRPGVTAPIIGPRTVEQLEDSLAALHLRLSDDVLNELEAIWPGPGGPAPEAYSW